MADQRQPCPVCAEPIQLDAKKCRYCGEWLPPEWSTVASEMQTPRAADPSVQPGPATAVAPPAAIGGRLDDGPAAGPEPSGLRHRVASIATPLIVCLAAAGILDGIATVSDLLQVGLVDRIANGETIGDAVLEANDARQQLLGGLQLLAILVAAPVFLIWLHRSYRLAGQVLGQPMKYTPGWAVGYWFVPFLNLVRPYQVVKEIWSVLTKADANSKPLSLISWWWGAFLVSGLLGRLAASMMQNAADVDSLLSASAVTALSDALSAVAALLAIRLVQRITAVAA